MVKDFYLYLSRHPEKFWGGVVLLVVIHFFVVHLPLILWLFLGAFLIIEGVIENYHGIRKFSSENDLGLRLWLRDRYHRMRRLFIKPPPSCGRINAGLDDEEYLFD
jgi:hypothetical protein